MKRALLFLFTLSLSSLLMGQNLEIGWQNPYGDSGDEHINKVIQASNGTLVAVGYTESISSKKRDGLLIIVDARNGRQIKFTNYGGNADDEFKGVAQTNDGSFVLVGKTESKGEGKADGWLLVIDAQGKVLRDETYGTNGEDQFNDVVYDQEGDAILVAGHINDGKIGDLWVLKFEGKRIAWDKQIGRSKYGDIRGVALDEEGGMVITGNMLRPKGQIYLVKVNKNSGQEEWGQEFGDREWEEAGDVIRDPRGGYAIVGSTTSKGNGRQDIWLIRTDDDGIKSWDFPYGGADDDTGFGVSVAEDGGYYIVGKTKSHSRNARTHKAILIKTSSGGAQEFSRDQYGGNREDEAWGVVQLHDGSIAITGRTESIGKGKFDAWMFNLKDPNKQLPPFLSQVDAKGQLDFNYLDITVEPKLMTHDGQLKPDDITYVSMTVYNRGNVDLPDVRVKVNPKDQGAKGIDFWEDNFIGKLSVGEQKEVFVPVKANSDLETGVDNFEILVTAGPSAVLESSEMKITKKKPVPATLVFQNSEFKMMPKGANDFKPRIRTAITFRNSGDYTTAGGMDVGLDAPNGLQILPAPTKRLQQIPPNGNITTEFYLAETANYRGPRKTVVQWFIRDSEGEKARGPLEIDLDNPVSTSAAVGTMVIWVDPNPNTGNVVKVSEREMDIRLAIGSSRQLTKTDITVFVDDNALDGNKDLDEETLTPSNDGTNSLVYGDKIMLKEGRNEIYVKVGDQESSKVIVEYEPESRNLHVLSIGPKHPDLQFTSKDAKDFAEAFKEQKGKLFNEVFVDLLWEPNQTNFMEIKKSFIDLKSRYNNDIIRRNDVLIVFISSHGVVGSEGRYKIIPSGFDPKYGDDLAVDYKQDILEQLKSVDCKKLIFIDACHSGAAGSRSDPALNDPERSEFIMRLNQQAPGMTSIASCKQSEMSYEDQQWKNGAFTKAILEAFQNLEVTDDRGQRYKASYDDNYITIKELHSFIERRVKDLVRIYKPEAPTSQTPEMLKGELDENIAIFVADN